MSTYTDASLIVTPNSKKAGKLYSLKGADLDVVRATTATYVDADGVIQTAGINEPRFDYSNGSCPSILVEPQRTNLVLRSEEFDVSPWVTQRSTISTNTTISPTGNLTADTFNLSNVGQNVYSLYQTGITSSSLTNTFSIYVKYTNRRYIQLTWFSAFSTTNFANFDLITGTITGGTYLDAKINNSYDGFFRISITSTGDSTNAIPYIWPIDTFNAPRASTSDGIGSYILFGAQLEAGANATSYIPTVASTVTRNADVISKTGLSDLIGQTDGTLFVELNLKNLLGNQNRRIISLSNNNSASENIQITFTSALTNTIRAVIASGGNFPLITSSQITSLGKIKIALAYSNTDAVLYINGIKQGIDLGATTKPTMNFISLGNVNNSDFLNDNINSAIIFPTRLSNTELAQLTNL